MAIPTSRAKSKAKIKIHREKCTGCGLCVSVCKDFSLKLKDNKVEINEQNLFGCIGCGHCMAICPAEAIKIYGRTLTPDDIFTLPSRDKAADYKQLLALYQRRRSIREFSGQSVEKEKINKIIKAAKNSPMGLPPSDVNLLVLDNKDKSRKFAKDFCKYLDNIKWLVSKWFLTLMRPFWGKTNDELFREFVRPAINAFIKNMKAGKNIITYDAPLVMYFYSSPYSDPADPIIAATFAMLAGESLGLGTCMLGSIHPLIQYGSKAKKFRAKYSIKYKSREGLFVIFGYPAVEYDKGIKRSFASITRA
ncbi:MAG: nitroreductase family protein [Candidatus Marinimicrobia bacterium]|nr:nitroreductase family protein [Candidatus Neomarinimicrobiota bacterium]